MKSVAFRTQARTVDHLGREQIADVPTAISELWKNSYDAYARKVELHVYSGDPIQVGLFDNGHGMSREEFEQKWLVVGTQSKTSETASPVELRQGLPERPKQGQKGIGRLSVAALGAVVLVISKTREHDFVAALIDWRLFENPLLLLDDIRIPVVEFSDPGELPSLYSAMRAELLTNLGGGEGAQPGLANDPERLERLRIGWLAYERMETENSKVLGGRLHDSPPADRIRSAHSETAGLRLDALTDWEVWSQEWPCGTAMLMSTCNEVFSGLLREDDPEMDQSITGQFKRTLEGFTDPFSDRHNNTCEFGDDFCVQMWLHTRHGGKERFLSGSEEVSADFIRSLEHFFEGDVDAGGTFRGRVKAFGKDFGEYKQNPNGFEIPLTATTRVGPFSIRVGTYEVDPKNSSHSYSVHESINQLAKKRAGLNIYRDGLRVLPYGRVENDFFKIERQRSINAGREYWAARRIFGSISISRKGNINLRDKAGREGLIDNTAARAFQAIVMGLLKDLAYKFYGSNSDTRAESLKDIQAENSAAAEKAKAAKSRSLASFRAAIKVNSPQLVIAQVEVERLRIELGAVLGAGDEGAILGLGDKIGPIVDTLDRLQLPPRPKKLGRHEQTYREYRDLLRSTQQVAEEMRVRWREASARLIQEPPERIAATQQRRNQDSVIRRVQSWEQSAVSRLQAEVTRVKEQAAEDRKRFYMDSAPVVEGVGLGAIPLDSALMQLDRIKDSLLSEMADRYDPYIRALTSLAEGVDLDIALSYSEARRDTLEEHVRNLHALAQIGISVEILGHELHSLNRRLDRGMYSLPADVQQTKEFRAADNARRELFERLRFLNRIQIIEGDLKRTIRGFDIYDYLVGFFRHPIIDGGVDFQATPEFKEVSLQEFPSRIYPVFINLVNNALYWVGRGSDKKIRLGVAGGGLIVADSGPGVDPDDQPQLFNLFFTKRLQGRGVGLYLCRETLAAGGHTIHYVNDDADKLLPGANFKIVLRDGLNA